MTTAIITIAIAIIIIIIILVLIIITTPATITFTTAILQIHTRLSPICAHQLPTPGLPASRTCFPATLPSSPQTTHNFQPVLHLPTGFPQATTTIALKYYISWLRFKSPALPRKPEPRLSPAIPVMSGEDGRWTQQRSGLIKYVQSKLLVRHLQMILKKLALPVSGLKVAQQARLIDQIDKVVDARNDEGLQQLKRLIYNPDAPDTHSSPGPSTAPLTQLPPKAPGYSSHPYNSSGLYSPLLSPAPPTMRPGTDSTSPPFSQLQLYYLEPMAKRSIPFTTASTPSLEFHQSPFYEPRANLTAIHGLQAFGPVTTTSRSVANITVQLSQQYADEIRQGLRAILYCAEGTSSGPHHVAFPQAIEIRVNGKAVSANLRGLKNKPGTTRPLDVTDYLDKTPGSKNSIMITYALSQKRYLAMVKLVRKSTPEDLVGQIKSRRPISKQAVLDRFLKDSEDDEVFATSTVMSLKCPASTLRIMTPIRSQFCKHNQCYDAISFLQLQEQAPTWNCPVCSKKIEFADLAVDKYVEEILNSVPRSVDAVTVDPMGDWTVPIPKESSPHIKRDYDEDEDEDEDSENEISILDTAPLSFKSNPSANGLHTPSASNGHHRLVTQPTYLSTPKSLSSEPLANSSARQNGGGSNKRHAPVTIDLTLSDDDDDTRPPPPKRHQASATPTPLSHQKPTDNSTGPFTISWSNPGYL
ncbi:SUMO ligase siz1 [Orbilia blumenaviensis]|uniref:SUMO ligase siz1 n=1 Tax=Orbilia blumenaviensis TaxID=1796055 RepID=A0AAV9VJ75_9PEZI